MQIARLLGTTNPAPTVTGSASTVENAHFVMLHNSGSTLREVVVQTAQNGTSLANIHLSAGERVIISKDPDEVIFAAHAEIKLTNVDPMKVN